MSETRIRRDLKRFGMEFLCLLVLLYGDPLRAISEAGATSAGLEVTDDAGAVADVDHQLDASSGLVEATVDLWKAPAYQVAAVGSALAGEPWLDALSILFAEGAGQPAAQQAPAGAPPAPPGFAGGARASKTSEEAADFGAKSSALDQIPLLAGWNLVSLPEEPADPDPSAVLAAIGGAYTEVSAYDACDPADAWKLYDPNDPAASDLTMLDHRRGFWIEATSAVDLPSDGTLPAATSFELCTGWNLIGFPAGQPRHVRNALQSIEGKYVRLFGYDSTDLEDPWEVFSVDVPKWANDLELMYPGRGYWVLVTEDVTLQIANQGPEPAVAISSPQDLDVVTEPTDVVGTVTSGLLESWALSYRLIGEPEWVEIESREYPVADGELGTFDPTLLKNGLYELRLEATDLEGRFVEESIAVSVEGQMKIGHFTLSFVDLAVPVSGLDIEVVRTYDSRDRRQGDFGFGWTLDIRQGSYTNNRPPGEGWRVETGFLPCDTVIETRSHLTVVRLSDREVYRFALRLADGAVTGGGCFATARFDFVDGPFPGTTLEILGNDSVFFANGSNEVIDADTLELYEPEDVRLTTRDGRIFELDLALGVTRLEDLNGNHLTITPGGITHSSGKGIDFERDAEGRIVEIRDPLDRAMTYAYDPGGSLVTFTDRAGNTTRFTYDGEHRLLDIEDPRGVKPIRNDYDERGRLIRHTDAYGQVIELDHDLENRREVMTDRLGHSRILQYDGRGNVVRETDELGKVTVRAFDGRDNLLSETDPLGRTTTYAYTANDDLASLTDALGNATTYTYNDRGQLLTVTDPRGGVTTSVYDSRGNLTRTTDALGNATTFTYDARGNLLTITDAAGGVTRFEYDASGNQTQEVDALGHETISTYDAAGNRLTESRTRTLSDSSRETLTTSFAYDALDRVTTTTAADGSTTSVTYDVLGKVTRHTDALGRVTAMTYDLMGRLVSTTYPDGTTEAQSYDAEGRLLSRTDRAGRTTTFLYDAAGRLTTTTFPDGATTANAYDDAGQLIASTDARGNTTTFVYDVAGRRTAVIDPLGNGPTFTYDASGNQTTVTGARGHTTGFAYDALNRLTRTTYPDGTTTEMAYDALGRRIAETDQAEITTEVGYDALGRLTSVKDPLEQVTSYSYDEIGNRLTQTDANGHTTRFEYDALGRQTARVLPDGARESMTYNVDGTLSRHTDFNGAVRTFEYDSNQRVIRRAYPDGGEVTFAYTPSGQRATVTDGRGTTTYAYDNRDRLREKTDPNGYKLTYAYDAQGNRTSLTATAGVEVYTTTYTYDALNRLATVTDSQGGVTTLSYDNNGNRATLAFPNGVTTSYTYDALSRLTNLATVNGVGEVIQSYAYTLGAAGNRNRIDEHDGTSRHYRYDALYRLTQDRVSDPAGALVYQQDFTYDSVGNRLSQVVDEGSGVNAIASNYDTRDRRLNVGSTTFGWDDNGNLTSQTNDGSTNYGWDFENRLTSVNLDDGAYVENSYGADGNRVRTTITSANGSTRTIDHLVDMVGPLSHVVAEIVNGQVETLYTRAGDQLIGFYRPVSGTERYYHADGLGSIRALSDETGEVSDSYNYSAFGRLLEHAGVDTQSYYFAGESVDINVKLYYNRTRWLDVNGGRFVSADSFTGRTWDPMSLHRYLYARASPVDYVDPSGREGLLSAISAAAIYGSLVGVAVGGVVGGISGGILGSEQGTSGAVSGFVTGLVGGAAAGALFGFIGGGLGALAVLTGHFLPLILWTGFTVSYGLYSSVSLLADSDPRRKLVGGIALALTLAGGVFAARGINYLKTGTPQKTYLIYEAGDDPVLGSSLPDGKYYFVVTMNNQIRYAPQDGLVGHGALAGGKNVLTAGEMSVVGGRIESINPKSGTYLPSRMSLYIAELILRYKGIWSATSRRLPLPPPPKGPQ